MVPSEVLLEKAYSRSTYKRDYCALKYLATEMRRLDCVYLRIIFCEDSLLRVIEFVLPALRYLGRGQLVVNHRRFEARGTKAEEETRSPLVISRPFKPTENSNSG